MYAAFNVKSNEPGVEAHFIRCEGGSSAISKSAGGAGIAVTRTGTGAYRLTFDDSQGTFLGWSCSLGAATPGDIAGHTAIRDEWDASNKRLDFIVYNDSDSAHDLAADEYADIWIFFKSYSV